MSDTSQGPGWWQASDGKWYPPEQAPGAAPQAPAGGYGAPQPGYGAPQPGYGVPPGYQPAGAAPAGGTGVGDAFGWGWKKFQEYVGPILIGLLVYLVASAVLYVIAVAIITSIDLGFFGQILIQIVAALLFSLIQMAIIRASLQIADGRQIEVGEMFKTEQLGQYLLAAVIVAVLSGIGTMLCILPGLIVSFFAAYFGYFLLDQKQDAIESIKSSFTFVSQNLGALVIFFLASLAAYIVGAILCGVGLLVAIPVVLLAQAFMYRRLSGGPLAA
jgi:uncharacterized membrane protein